jgi:type IV secretion system protein VirB3/type IV secretion system protein VirB4
MLHQWSGKHREFPVSVQRRSGGVMTDLKIVPIRRSLLRHTLVMGGERDLVMTSAMFAMLTGASGMSFLAWTIGGLFWLIALFALRRMAKADPCMSKIWLRHLTQQNFYSARSTAWAVEKRKR